MEKKWEDILSFLNDNKGSEPQNSNDIKYDVDSFDILPDEQEDVPEDIYEDLAMPGDNFDEASYDPDEYEDDYETLDNLDNLLNDPGDISEMFEYDDDGDFDF